ncbi:MAG: biotin transporter BioY [Clostridia bacterium]|nr:biotin transporter BioY [Clostridia bacterium]
MTDTKKLIYCALFTALISVGAFIKIPVPYLDYFTAQFFFVILAGIVLGPKLGAQAVAIYVILGLAGLPIFAAGGGVTYVFRPSFGYLLGFIATAFVVGYVCSFKRNQSFKYYLLAAFCGLITTYAIGLTYKYLILYFYLQTPVPWSVLVLSCFPLDIPGDLILCFAAALIGLKLNKSRLINVT